MKKIPALSIALALALAGCSAPGGVDTKYPGFLKEYERLVGGTVTQDEVADFEFMAEGLCELRDTLGDALFAMIGEGAFAEERPDLPEEAGAEFTESLVENVCDWQ